MIWFDDYSESVRNIYFFTKLHLSFKLTFLTFFHSFELQQKKLRNDLKTLKYVATTADAWTCRNRFLNL